MTMIIDGSAGATFPNSTVQAISATQGVTDGSNAAAGQVGEYIEAVKPFASAQALNNNVYQSLLSITLTPGDWQVTGRVSVVFTGTAGSSLIGAISTSATATTNEDTVGVMANGSLITGSTHTAPIPPIRYNITSTTTLYLIVYATIPSSATGWGRISARRIR